MMAVLIVTVTEPVTTVFRILIYLYVRANLRSGLTDLDKVFSYVL